jgi:hypothetical protein
VSDSHEVMTAVIVVLPLIVVVEISLQLHWSSFFSALYVFTLSGVCVIYLWSWVSCGRWCLGTVITLQVNFFHKNSWVLSIWEWTENKCSHVNWVSVCCS